MDVVILAGGKGTRLSKLTREVPKGLVPIGERPILWHIMRHYAAFGYRRFVLCVGYEGQQIADYFAAEAATQGWEVVCSDAGEKASKSDRIKAAMEHVQTDRFWLGYGDDLADVDLDAVDSQARSSHSIVTLSAVQPLSPYGVIDLEEAGDITGFREKCRMSDWINGGFMSVHRDIADYLHLGELEVEVFEALVTGKRINAHRHQGFWKAMNTYKDYLELNKMLEAGELDTLASVNRAQAA